uniref:Uncharacterized protein n=1 Tax=Anguilla anguilla TaxID=7936 RepID=A0A0E9V947_ANGAN
MAPATFAAESIALSSSKGASRVNVFYL